MVTTKQVIENADNLRQNSTSAICFFNEFAELLQQTCMSCEDTLKKLRTESKKATDNKNWRAIQEQIQYYKGAKFAYRTMLEIC